MATSIKLKSDIKKIEAAIKSKATPKSLVSKLETQLDKLKSDLASLSSAKPKKGVTKTKVLSSLQKLKAKIKSTKSLSGYKRSGIDIEKDADVPALPLGRRTAKTTGNTYYEYRLNRADVKQPPKRYPKLEKGGYMAKGGMVVTSIKDIPNFKQRLEERKITYRGLGMGKKSDDFYDLAGENGKSIKVDGKEYYITDTEFDSFSRGSDGKLRIRFDAPYKKSYADGGDVDEYDGDPTQEETYAYTQIYYNPNPTNPKKLGTKYSFLQPYVVDIDGKVYSMSGTRGKNSVIELEGWIDEYNSDEIKSFGEEVYYYDAPEELKYQILKVKNNYANGGMMAKGGMMKYPYLLQEKSSTSGKWKSVYSFAKSSEIDDRIEEYKKSWNDREVRVIKNPKYADGGITDADSIYYIHEKLDHVEANPFYQVIDRIDQQVVSEHETLKSAENWVNNHKYMADGGMMAKGGMTEHGLMIGDMIVDEKDNGMIIVSNEQGYHVVDLPNGKRERIDFKMASGGRTLSAINRDRAYKSDEAWEQNYTRKSRPKNPKYKSSSDFFEEGGEMHRLFDEGEA